MNLKPNEDCRCWACKHEGLQQDTDTLASNELESTDRVVAFRYFCVCGDDNNDHDCRDVDSPLNSDSMQAIEILGCRKCNCKKYKEAKKELIDYSQEASDDIFGDEIK